MNNTSKRLPLLAAALVLTAGAAVAADTNQSAPQPVTPEGTAATSPAPAAQPAGDGLAAAKVGQDPKTGELRQLTAAEDAELEAQMKAFWAQFSSVSHTVKKDRRTGRMSYVVAPTQMRAAIATIGADGKVVWDCASAAADPAKVAAQLKAKPAPAADQREEQ